MVLALLPEQRQTHQMSIIEPDIIRPAADLHEEQWLLGRFYSRLCCSVGSMQSFHPEPHKRTTKDELLQEEITLCRNSNKALSDEEVESKI